MEPAEGNVLTIFSVITSSVFDKRQLRLSIDRIPCKRPVYGTSRRSFKCVSFTPLFDEILKVKNV